MVQGRGVDASLNETGRTQADKVFHHLREVSFDVVYTSALVRTHQTAKGFIDAGIPHRVHDGFDEISWGSQEGVEATTEAKTLYARTVQSWQDGKLHLNVGGGESPIQVMERQKVAMQEVLDFEGSTILVCMHGRALRVLLCWLLNHSLRYMDGFPHDNCAYYKLTYRGDFVIEEFNVKEHLT